MFSLCRAPSRILLATTCFCTSLLTTNVAQAACNPAEDPCAPKKEIGSWDKSLAFGFNYTSGNSDTSALSLLGRAKRETTEDVIDFDLTSGSGEDRARDTETVDAKNKDDFRANANYKYLLGGDWFAGAGWAFLYDDIAQVDYRTSLTPVVGYYLLKDEDFTLSVDAGPGYTFERVASVDNDFFSPKIGERFDWIISCTSKIYQKADIFFDTSNSDNYLVNAEAGVESALSTSLSLVFLVRDTYDNEPAVDREKNDVAMITAVKVAL
ncbi:MAG: DUF481 domain-containing protein [Deltaproteobacteria bacterium]|nr:DUF481 domain-containing protein [Deltaproteobacteria bacterium]